jgi:hypothetical protein
LMERSFTGDIRQFAGHGPAMLTRREEHNASSWVSIMLRRECLRQQQGGAHIRMQMPIYFVRCEVFEAWNTIAAIARILQDAQSGRHKPNSRLFPFGFPKSSMRWGSRPMAFRLVP